MTSLNKKIYPERRRRVLVAMSGGVDSSVAAALLRQAGFNVAGGFMKCWEEKDLFGNCTSAADEKVARQVARKLNIPLYVFDFTKEYRKQVFDYFIAEYKAGRTPNPDVMCNKEIKFGLFLEKAKKLGFDYMATGHYVRLKRKETKETKATRGKVYKLMRGKDRNKDQSYFLWRLTQGQLKHCLFPVGDYTKPQVRKMARKFGLPNAEKKDSQGICFVGQVKLADFLKNYIKSRPGKILAPDGKILGGHSGIHSYTIGQRHGIGLAGGPWWVLRKEIKKNVLFVTRQKKDLEARKVILRNIHWVSGAAPQLPLKISAAIRYRQKASSAVLRKEPRGSYALAFTKPQSALAAGQSVVFWRGEELLGGGIIV